MKTQKTKNILITCLVLTLMLFSIFSFLVCNNFKVFSNFVTTYLNNAYKISQANSNNNASTNQNTNDNEDRQDDPQNENSKITNTSTCVSVGEIWNDTTKQFKKNELLQLIKYASNETITIDNLTAIKNKKIDANTMRSYNGGKDILVTLGGLQWTITYLSQDKSGNPILTFWLASSSDKSTWNSGFSPSYYSLPAIPDNMYGTSYIRAVTLNNSGWYSTASSGSSGATATQNTSNKFARFTMTNEQLKNTSLVGQSLIKYITIPANVNWQEYQSFKNIIKYSSWLLDVPNEGWALKQQNSNYYTDGNGYNYNYSFKDKYDIWKNDLIWLPSTTELGFVDDRVPLYTTGIWGASANQLSNPIYPIATRSVNHNYAANAHSIMRTTCIGGDYSVNTSYAVRPAFHLNLKEAIASAFDIWGYSQFVSDNLNLLLKYVNGTNTATTNSSLLSSLSSTIGSGAMLSSTIKTNANKVTDKTFLNSNNELLIKFYGLDWYAVFITKDTTTPTPNIILTLFLADSEQLYGKNKTSGVTYNKYGNGTFNSGSPPYINGSTTISNNYGNNYVRTTLLSSGNTTSVFYPYTKTSTNKTAIGDFIVAPKDLNSTANVQATQSAKSTLGFRYNLPNESYANLINYSNPYKALSLSASTTNYTSWQNDKLWLPSLSEVGLGTNNTISTNTTASNNLRTAGLWGLSTAQRSNTNKTATWLRSGHITDKNLAYTISADGTEYGYATIDTQKAIRPALHLNLTLACQYAS